jgi:3-phosphoshikimate 1-carboxyvinyltransferase
LKIFPSAINKSEVGLQANVSSQYISALMLIAPKLKPGLQINLDSEITSLPYLKMTEKLMLDLGFQVKFENNSIIIKPKPIFNSQSFHVESDWSSASYFYSLVALNSDLRLTLKTFKEESLQGDSALSKLYEPLGVKTTFCHDYILLENKNEVESSIYSKNLNNNPDLAQTIVVTCLGLGKSCRLEGLHTLKIKETDRLEALKTEIEKLGAEVNIGNDWLEMKPTGKIRANQTIGTYNDHRMAMAFAPLCSVTSLSIKNPEVVTKSYPAFWKDLERLLK